MKKFLQSSLLFALFLSSANLALSQVYTFNATLRVNGNPTPNQLVEFQIYVPEEVTQPLGVIVFSNGSGEDRRYMGAVGWIQSWARSLGYAVLGSNWSIPDDLMNSTRQNLQDALNQAATTTGRSNLINAPIFALGNSFGGIFSLHFPLQNPERTLGFAASKGVDLLETYAQTGVPGLTGWNQIFGVWNPGEVDGNSAVHPYAVQQSFQLWRTKNATTAFVLEYNTGHFDMDGQFYDLAFMTSAVAHALRHPGTPPSSTPNTTLSLSNFTLSSGWYAERPTFTGNFVATWNMTYRPTWPQIAPVANFTGNASIASWLPNELMARVY
ncbi:MAG: hypothetical protein N2035_10535, partial [Chthoniobacterales bacterium]|nr:hypothetical protein [Chthoniobacterales bacterium]